MSDSRTAAGINENDVPRGRIGQLRDAVASRLATAYTFNPIRPSFWQRDNFFRAGTHEERLEVRNQRELQRKKDQLLPALASLRYDFVENDYTREALATDREFGNTRATIHERLASEDTTMQERINSMTVGNSATIDVEFEQFQKRRAELVEQYHQLMGRAIDFLKIKEKMLEDIKTLGFYTIVENSALEQVPTLNTTAQNLRTTFLRERSEMLARAEELSIATKDATVAAFEVYKARVKSLEEAHINFAQRARAFIEVKADLINLVTSVKYSFGNRNYDHNIFSNAEMTQIINSDPSIQAVAHRIRTQFTQLRESTLAQIEQIADDSNTNNLASLKATVKHNCLALSNRIFDYSVLESRIKEARSFSDRFSGVLARINNQSFARNERENAVNAHLREKHSNLHQELADTVASFNQARTDVQRITNYINASNYNESIASFNIFVRQCDRSLARYNEIMQQGELLLSRHEFRTQFLNLEVHSRFNCPLTGAKITSPVLTPYGDCFQSDELIRYTNQHATCPKTNRLLETRHLIRDDRRATSIIRDYNAAHAAMLTKIDTMTHFTLNQASLLNFSVQMNHLANNLDAVKQETAQANQARIAGIKERLRLDINNVEHLRYWNNKTSHCFHGFGGVEIVHSSGLVVRVPTRIHAMMKEAAQGHQNAEHFISCMNRLRETAKRWSNPFSFFTRNAVTARVYETANIETLDLRPVGMRR